VGGWDLKNNNTWSNLRKLTSNLKSKQSEYQFHVKKENFPNGRTYQTHSTIEAKNQSMKRLLLACNAYQLSYHRIDPD
jgi:phosphodiesterase/alkaline phosphatase D-like protein